MDYYDGNTVTGLWNYAQRFAMNDNSYGTTFGPSSPGAVNVIAGNTYGAICGPASAVFQAPACTAAAGSPRATPGTVAAQGPGTMYSDTDPYFDVCSRTKDATPVAPLGMDHGDDDLDAKVGKARLQIERTAELIRRRHQAFQHIPADRPMAGLIVTPEPFSITHTLTNRLLRNIADYWTARPDALMATWWGKGADMPALRRATERTGVEFGVDSERHFDLRHWAIHRPCGLENDIEFIVLRHQLEV